MFVGRTVYRHPEVGPMIVERAQLDFMKPMCDAIHAQGSPTTLLALPYPYPNYFCDVPPWDGYVQTWYDTSGPSIITSLEGKLDKAPPRWVMYQRGLDTMAMHEAAMQPFRELPQRGLDREILSKVETDQWTIVRRACFEGSDWILLRTTPPNAGEHHGIVSDADDRYNACLLSDVFFWRKR